MYPTKLRLQTLKSPETAANIPHPARVLSLWISSGPDQPTIRHLSDSSDPSDLSDSSDISDSDRCIAPHPSTTTPPGCRRAELPFPATPGGVEAYCVCLYIGRRHFVPRPMPMERASLRMPILPSELRVFGQNVRLVRPVRPVRQSPSLRLETIDAPLPIGAMREKQYI